jgi:hypothetical protein
MLTSHRIASPVRGVITVANALMTQTRHPRRQQSAGLETGRLGCPGGGRSVLAPVCMFGREPLPPVGLAAQLELAIDVRWHRHEARTWTGTTPLGEAATLEPDYVGPDAAH